MDIQMILIGNGFFLALILFIFLIILTFKPKGSTKSKKVGSDIKKIKDQINGK